MHPVRPDAHGDARTERVSGAPCLDLDQLTTDAREHGLVWLRDHALPDPSDPDHLTTLLAVMRLDLERPGAASGRLTEYRRVFAALRTTPEGRRGVRELETDSARRILVHTPRPSAVDNWRRVDAVTENTPAPSPLVEMPTSAELSVAASGPRDVPELDPAVAAELGFTELVRLGQGGFGTVYAARQPSVGNRLVAIKYTAARSREPQVLAALQHPNIMPVWSVHESAGHRVFCMPLHGRTTVADVLKMIDRTKSLPATGAGFLSAASVREAERAVAVPVEPTTELAEDAPEYESERRRLAKLGYVESVVQGVARLADALSHAHRRRVVHLDIKPANILITDDGGFMILDFGLAYQNGLPASPEAGGTVRYMAPEQLSAFASGQGVRPDPRMDLYALGLVFFELLTGRHPFAESLAPGVRREEWVAARLRHPPRVRRFNPAVPPGVEAIVCKLLHPDRTQRYQSAEQVLTDLTRHQAHQPLAHAGNPSAWERFAKFRRRHPVFSVAVMAVLLAGLAVGGFWVAKREADNHAAETVVRQAADAEEQLDDLLGDMTAVRIDAGSLQSATARRQAVSTVDRWRTAYAVDTDPRWRERPHFARLPDARRQQLRFALGEQALLAAHAERLNALGRPADAARVSLDRAVEWNRRAEEVFAPDVPPSAVGEQRAVLARLTGRTLADPPPPPPDAPLDLYLRAVGRIADGNHTGARLTLEELERREQKHAAGQFALGFVYQQSGRFADAAERYQVARVLADRDPRPPLNRGMLLLHNGRVAEALADLDAAVDRDPRLEVSYYLRVITRLKLAAGFPAGERPRMLDTCKQALADVARAIELGGRRYRTLFLQLRVCQQMGDQDAARKVQAELEALAPADDEDFICRGNWRVSDARWLDAAGDHAAADQKRREAVADFTRAVELNPLSVQGWNNLATQHAALGHTRQAADAFGRVLALMPDLTLAKFQRAVLLARLGERDEALAQIADLPPATADAWYQRAAVYALTSAVNLNDRADALQALIVVARSGGMDWELYDADADFDLVRDLPDFTQFRARKGRPVD